MEVNRRTQADRSAATRGALVAAARPLFAEHGFASVGTEAIVQGAGVTRGAMYHQFDDKTELFAAVFEAVEQDVQARLMHSVDSSGVTDPIDAMELGADAWLEVCADPEVQQIVLLDAPVVLGWERWREVGMRYGMGLVESLLAYAIDVGRIPKQAVAPLAHVLIGALDEAVLYIARAPDPPAAQEEMRLVIRQLVRSLAVDPPAAPKKRESSTQRARPRGGRNA